MKIANIESLEVNFDIESQASGSHNLAFEFWVTSDSMSNEISITTEVMIRASNSLMEPAGNQISVVFVDGYYFSLFRSDFENWVYYAFISLNAQFNGKLNIYNFINYMISTNHLSSNDYLASFELGNEIVYGNGQTNINHYSFHVNEDLSVKLDRNIQEKKLLVFNPVPNPFNPVTSVGFRLPENMFLEIKIYDLLVRPVRNLMNQEQLSGYGSVRWNGTNNKG